MPRYAPAPDSPIAGSMFCDVMSSGAVPAPTLVYSRLTKKLALVASDVRNEAFTEGGEIISALIPGVCATIILLPGTMPYDTRVRKDVLIRLVDPTAV